MDQTGYQVNLDVFEGPLSRLLLVKASFEPDIPISLVNGSNSSTDTMASLDLDVAASTMMEARSPQVARDIPTPEGYEGIHWHRLEEEDVNSIARGPHKRCSSTRIQGGR